MSQTTGKKTHQKSQNAEEHASAQQSAPTSVQPGPKPMQPKDAQLIGAGRKEQIRLLKKNVEDGQAEGHPDLPAGQHATGSFTGENEKKK
jgi:hypothetical protein